MGAGLLPVIGRLESGHRLGYAGLPDGQAAACKLAPSACLRRNFYVDTMGSWPPHLREAVEVFGADRVLPGSDYPAVPISPREHIDIIRSLGLGAIAGQKILGRNAQELFQLDLAPA